MGREIRRVPKDWEHPINEECRHRSWGGYTPHDGEGSNDFTRGKCFRSCYDKDYESAAQAWIASFFLWLQGKHHDQQPSKSGYVTSAKYYWEWTNTPDEDTCRPAFTSEPTGYQIYETVSEGTPVSPVFETLADMEAWLVGHGYSSKAASAFCKQGWVPSMIYSPETGLVSDIETAGLND